MELLRSRNMEQEDGTREKADGGAPPHHPVVGGLWGALQEQEEKKKNDVAVTFTASQQN